MSFHVLRSRRVAGAVAAALLFAVTLSACGSSSKKSSSGTGETTTTEASSLTKASGAVRGFDGTTITVGGIGIKSQLPGVVPGIEARIKRFNDSNEIPGIKLKLGDFADDKLDPAVALSESRRLVTEVKAFALVGDISSTNPGQYFAQQHVPYFGYAFDNTYCRTKATTSDIWGFGMNGCLVPTETPVMPQRQDAFFAYAKQQLGKDKPSFVIFSTDTTSGRTGLKLDVAEFAAAGFDVIGSKAIIPPPPVTDYSPYVQQLLTSDNGHAPDVIACYAAVDCIPVWTALKAQGFKGIYYHTLYADALLKAFAGTIVGIGFGNFADSNPAMDQFKADVKAAAPDQSIDIGVAAGYLTTSMFIDAVKIVAKKGKDYITPENVRAAASTMTFEVKGVVGPTKYPDSEVKPTPACSTLLKDTGTEWQTLSPYTCNTKSVPIK